MGLPVIGDLRRSLTTTRTDMLRASNEGPAHNTAAARRVENFTGPRLTKSCSVEGRLAPLAEPGSSPTCWAVQAILDLRQGSPTPDRDDGSVRSRQALSGATVSVNNAP